MQIQGKSHASGILGQAPLLGKLRRNYSHFPAERVPGWALSMAMPSQAGLGESDNVGHLVIRKESSSPLNAGCFIWSQKTRLALIVCSELVDKGRYQKGTPACKDESKPLTLIVAWLGIWNFLSPWAASRSLYLSSSQQK